MPFDNQKTYLNIAYVKSVMDRPMSESDIPIYDTVVRTTKSIFDSLPTSLSGDLKKIIDKRYSNRDPVVVRRLNLQTIEQNV
jgi:hypothetical protein